MLSFINNVSLLNVKEDGVNGKEPSGVKVSANLSGIVTVSNSNGRGLYNNKALFPAPIW